MWGVGPAFIKSFRIKYKNQCIDDWPKVINALENKVFIKRQPEYTALFENDMVKVEAHLDLLVTLQNRVKNKRHADDLFQNDLDVEIVCCSIYGIFWRTCWLNSECKNRAISVRLNDEILRDTQPSQLKQQERKPSSV